MIVKRDVPPAEWRRVLDDLSRLHAGAVVTLEVLDVEQGRQTHGEGFTLVGLTADGGGSDPSIAAILAGRSHLTHLVEHARRLHVQALWETRTASVDITQADGTRTFIRLGPPVLPDGRRHGVARLSDNGPPAAADPP
jgi:hypothetical protein